MPTSYRPAVSRRNLLHSAALFGAAAAAGCSTPKTLEARQPAAAGELKGNIRHSMIAWCFQNFGGKWDIEKQCQVASELGIESVELIDPKFFPVLKKYDRRCAIIGSHGFKDGPNHKKNWDMCRQKITERLEAASTFGCPSVITFTGFADGIDPEEGARNCVEFFKSVAGEAEKKNVTLCIEHLNSRADDHPMKGHPGYQGDHVDYCVDIIKKVGSPNFKLLFDVYHVQIMDGDLVRRIHQIGDLIGHIHTAGNPGRGELDDTQEIFYPPVMKALVKIGYKGFVGHEFIPTRDAYEGLKQAVTVCDV